MRKLKRWLGLLLLLLLALAGFVIWASMSSSPMPEALAALQSDAQVQVETEGWLIFRPVDGEPAVGLILYPGGRVDPRAYAPPARAIAAEGYLVVMVPMPLNLAFFGPDRAAEVMAAFPEVERWAVGGHSLGGAMAARFAHRHPSAVQGLVLWASYPAASDDLSARAMLEEIAGGQTDAAVTDDLAQGRMRNKIPELEKALSGIVQPRHRFLLAQQLGHVDVLDEQTETISAAIGRRIEGMSWPDEPAEPGSSAHTEEGTPMTHKPGFPLSWEAAVPLLDTNPGVAQRKAEFILAQMGLDMSRFPTTDDLAS